MPDPVDPLQPLRDALRLSPDNLPLRQNLADSLAGLGRFPEAEQDTARRWPATPTTPA
jgi:hypothetical protein